jgi:hypothetical protein
LCHNIVPSNTRTIAFGKYLVVLAASRQKDEQYAVAGVQGNSSAQRLRLHLLYVVNDVLHWTKFHDGRALSEALAKALFSAISQILCISAARDEAPKHRKYLADLISIWDESEYFSPGQLEELKCSFQIACEKGEVALTDTLAKTASLEHGKEVPWTMPAMHGDPLTPYYDLPAANMMPHIVPNSSRPIDTYRMTPLQFKHGPADPKLVSVVQDFLKDVDEIYNPQDEVGTVVTDIDAMGQTIVLDEMGERIGGETYYGWSRAFCEKMQKHAAGGSDARDASRGRASSLSDSNHSGRSSRSRTPKKRRRSESCSRSRSRSRTRRRSRYTSSRSRSRSRSQARVHSPTPPHDSDRPALPQPVFGHHPPQLQQAFNRLIPPPPLPMSVPGLAMGLPIPPPHMALPMIQNGMPIPPPRPANWTGPWPPLPPPVPGASFGMPYPPYLGGHPPPPPANMPGNWNASASRGGSYQDHRRQ